ncbi:MAG: sugar transferase, partial [bacterium]|nr:sugar transferase [bacterium]
PVIFFFFLATGAVLFPFLVRRSKYGVLHRQGFLRLVSLGKLRGTLVTNEAGLADIDILVVDPGELDEIGDDGKAKLDPRLKKALENGTSMETVPEFLARNYGFIEIKHHVKARQVKLKKARLYDGFKVAFETVITLVLLILLAPVFAVVWCLVYFFSGSPVIFRQERTGKGGRSFNIYKFRTMENDGNNARGLGEFLRDTHMDELPQFFNIIKGDMVLIGPRPEWIYLASPEKAPADYWIRRTVKPGLSGWAQVNYRPSFSKYMR